jgi:cell division protein FtsX
MHHKGKKPKMRSGETYKMKFNISKGFTSCTEIIKRRQRMKHDTLIIISVMGMLLCAALLVLLNG